MNKKFNLKGFCCNSIFSISFVILLYLAIVSLTSKVDIVLVSEYTTIRLNIIGPILVTIIYYIGVYKTLSKVKDTKRLTIFGLFILLLYFVILALIGPRPYNDQGSIYVILGYLRNGLYDILNSNYLRVWSNQFKPLMLFGLLSGSYTIVYIINTIGYIGSYFLLPQIIRNINHNKDKEIVERKVRSGIICFITFIPLALYTHFFYGESLSITLLFLVLNSLVKFFSNKETIADYILIPTCFLLAYFCRDYTLIFLIATSITLIIGANKKNILKRLLVIALSWGFVLSVNSIVSGYFNLVYNHKIESNNTLLSWVTMGLMDEEDCAYENEVYTQEGAYNSYNFKVVLDNNFDKEAVSSQVKTDLKKQINKLVSNPSKSAKFFFNKMSKQWTESDFAGSVGLASVDTENRFGVLTLYSPVRDVYSWYTKGYYCFMVISLLFYIKNMKTELTDMDVLLLLFLIGGFIFSSFWEAKPRYNLPYFTMLIPLFSSSSIYLDEQIKGFCAKLKNLKRVGGA